MKTNTFKYLFITGISPFIIVGVVLVFVIWGIFCNKKSPDSDKVLLVDTIYINKEIIDTVYVEKKVASVRAKNDTLMDTSKFTIN